MLIADLHIHSKYSRATSKECVPEYLELWARRKGIDLIGTGDFTHPAWRKELEEKLEPAEEGLYRLKREHRLDDGVAGPACPRFLVSGEISSIYKKNGRVRKVHNLILLPGLTEAQRLSEKLEAIGNIHSDGRPILGLDSRDLLEITLDTCPEAIFIPAHIWTPHFSLFGAFSGFDTIEECFEDMTPYIHALETGLSSDPPMNWRISALDRFTLVSNSDAHSPSKLGREANLFDTALSYPELAKAMQDRTHFGGTIEFFPEEGKYHLDGHRNCDVCLKPSDAEAENGLCPVCKKKLTIGVLHRVEQLADREEGFVLPEAPRFESLVPLPEVIAASTGFTPASTKVQARYEQMLRELGSEFHILREAPLEEIRHVAGSCVAEGIRRMRCGEITLRPGYDGEYGKIHILDEKEIGALSGQMSLFGAEPEKKKEKPLEKKANLRRKQPEKTPQGDVENQSSIRDALAGLNREQQAAVTAPDRMIAVIAGPGTGKTKTLVSRIAYLVQECGAAPEEITAVTFTNKAAGEMRERLERWFGDKRLVRKMTIGTFHSICLRILSKDQEGLTLVDEAETLAVAQEVIESQKLKIAPSRFLQAVSARKNGMDETDTLTEQAFAEYQNRLKDYGAVDFDDLLLCTLERFGLEGAVKAPDEKRFTHLLVDEFQDINDLQHRLVKVWSRKSKSVFVIGDPDQSIYGFRGASAQCFEHLEQEYPDMRKIQLVQNYRSTPQILGCAMSVISHNRGIVERKLSAQRPDGIKTRLITAADDLPEGIFIAKEIGKMVGGIDMLAAQAGEGQRARGFSDIAILYRTHRQAELLEKCLRIEGIPYIVTGRDKTLSDTLVRGTVGFFRYLLNGKDRMALIACLITVMGCPASAARELADLLVQDSGAPLVKRVERLPEPLRSIEKFQRWIDLSIAYLPRVGKEKTQKLLESWILDNDLSGSLPLERLVRMSVFHNRMADFLYNLQTGEESDLSRSGGKRYLSDAVSLMTLHGAKGLEFPVVFLSGVKNGTLPLDMPGRSADMEEERRLFYVGMTRAQEELILVTSRQPSPFLSEIPASAIEKHDAAEERILPQGKQLSLF